MIYIIVCHKVGSNYILSFAYCPTVLGAATKRIFRNLLRYIHVFYSLLQDNYDDYL